jgi:hypothetical protein
MNKNATGKLGYTANRAALDLASCDVLAVEQHTLTHIQTHTLRDQLALAFNKPPRLVGNENVLVQDPVHYRDTRCRCTLAHDMRRPSTSVDV